MQTATNPPEAGKEPDIASASPADTLAALRVNPEAGLTQAQVDALRKVHGYNDVAEQKEHPVLKFLAKFWGLSAWILELIMILSLVLRNYADLAIVGALLVVNAVLGHAIEGARSHALGGRGGCSDLFLWPTQATSAQTIRTMPTPLVGRGRGAIDLAPIFPWPRNNFPGIPQFWCRAVRAVKALESEGKRSRI